MRRVVIAGMLAAVLLGSGLGWSPAQASETPASAQIYISMAKITTQSLTSRTGAPICRITGTVSIDWKRQPKYKRLVSGHYVRIDYKIVRLGGYGGTTEKTVASRQWKSPVIYKGDKPDLSGPGGISTNVSASAVSMYRAVIKVRVMRQRPGPDTTAWELTRRSPAVGGGFSGPCGTTRTS